jgi:hypothetical protein
MNTYTNFNRISPFTILHSYLIESVGQGEGVGGERVGKQEAQNTFQKSLIAIPAVEKIEEDKGKGKRKEKKRSDVKK